MISNDPYAIFAPGVRQYVETLIQEGRFGICTGCVKIMESKSGIAPPHVGACYDRFKIALPLAGHFLTWEVLFNAEYPEDPPDFIFSANEHDFQPNMDNLYSLVNWSPTSSRSLLSVIEELLLEHQLYRFKLLQDFSRLQWEYNSLVESPLLSPRDIEINFSRKSENKFGKVSFMIKLPVDFCGLPVYQTGDNPGPDSAVLLVTFHSPEGSSSTPQLFLSPRVEHCLGGSANLHIPPFPNGTCLMDYVPTVCDLLKNKIHHVVSANDKRKEYITSFLSRFGRAEIDFKCQNCQNFTHLKLCFATATHNFKSVIEYDAEKFSRISFLLEWHNFFFIINIAVPPQFPSRAPTVTFQSIYHETSDSKPYAKNCADLPYSPRWTTSEMVDRTRAYLLDNISNFQRESVTEGQLQQQ